MRLAATLTFLIALGAFGDDIEDRMKIPGTWQSDTGETWTIDDKIETIKLVSTRNNEKVLEYECSAVGKECAVKIAGKPVKVMLYFSGPRLVQMETRGNDVTKRTFQITAGDVLEMVRSSVSGSGKPETTKLKRTASTATTAEKKG